MSKQWSRSIPTKPPVLLPAKKAFPQLGTQVPDVVAMDRDRLETSDEFEQQARCKILEREAVDVSDRYSNMQPTSATAKENVLIGKRMDVCLQYFLNDGGTDILWIQGGVISASDGENSKEARSTSVMEYPS